jgi:hypothetical protein
MIFLCNECDKEFLTESQLDAHTQNGHSDVLDFDCEQCDYVGSSIDILEHHRKLSHFHFKYYCAPCNYATTNKDLLRAHRQDQHNGMSVQTNREKVIPPPRCNPRDVNHSSVCCDRDPREKKAVIYSHKQRETNGICLDWNKGKFDQLELCAFLHIEIEECRYANYCSRSNCRFWHNLPKQRKNW